jgi:hypothetical protein
VRDDGESLLPSGRPPHRWFLVGAARSGSALHVDPWATAAWNTVVSGRKRWVLFPPGAARALWPMVAALDEDDTACHWLHHDYGAMCDAVAAEGLEGFDFVQEAGETVYIPSGFVGDRRSMMPCTRRKTALLRRADNFRVTVSFPCFA